jgi:hypothetical protein
MRSLRTRRAYLSEAVSRENVICLDASEHQGVAEEVCLRTRAGHFGCSQWYQFSGGLAAIARSLHLSMDWPSSSEVRHYQICQFAQLVLLYLGLTSGSVASSYLLSSLSVVVSLASDRYALRVLRDLIKH